MTSGNAAAIINVVFIPVYATVAIGALINILCVGFKSANRSGFLSLELFGVVRTAGDVVLVYAHYSKTTNIGIYTAGFLLQGLGWSFLFSCALSIYETLISLIEPGKNVVAQDADETASIETPKDGRPTPGLIPRVASFVGSRKRSSSTQPSGEAMKSAGAAYLAPGPLLNYVNIAAQIVLIVGYSTSSVLKDAITSSSSGGSMDISMPATIKAGNVLLLIATVMLLLLISRAFTHARAPASTSPTVVMRPLLLLGITVVPFLLARILYAVITSFSSNPFAGYTGGGSGIWYRLVFFYVTEAAAALLLIATGLVLYKTRREAAERGSLEGTRSPQQPEGLALAELGRPDSSLAEYTPGSTK